jgi:hypothetical protein
MGMRIVGELVSNVELWMELEVAEMGCQVLVMVFEGLCVCWLDWAWSSWSSASIQRRQGSAKLEAGRHIRALKP